MADMHVIDGDGNGNWLVVMHFAVPNQNNPVGINWRTALKNSSLLAASRLKDGDGTGGTISAAEKTQIQNGELYEHVVPFLVETGGTTNPQIIATLRALYAAEESRVLAELQRRLKYFGRNESKA